MSRLAMEAWNVWADLDTFGRDLDTMGGNPLPLRQEAMDRVLAQCADPDAVSWRLKFIERIVLKWRTDRVQRERKK